MAGSYVRMPRLTIWLEQAWTQVFQGLAYGWVTARTNWATVIMIA